MSPVRAMSTAALDGVRYGVEVPLPGPVDHAIRAWIERTPGATWPSWGGHVTIMDFLCPEELVGRVSLEIEAIVRRFQPFRIDFDRIVVDRHALRPQYETVLLMADPDEDADERRSLVRLHNHLWTALTHLDRRVQPVFMRRPYVPHITLTWGTDRTTALRIAEAARKAGLVARFRADQLVFLRLIPCADRSVRVDRVRVFDLTGPVEGGDRSGGREDRA